ncbi:MAG: hypothetical protein M1836_002504 [Candelina mexicana]|nr:MAG: hypothetical protein M1836_002504 [Candelina mexicana]
MLTYKRLHAGFRVVRTLPLYPSCGFGTSICIHDPERLRFFVHGALVGGRGFVADDGLQETSPSSSSSSQNLVFLRGLVNHRFTLDNAEMLFNNFQIYFRLWLLLLLIPSIIAVAVDNHQSVGDDLIIPLAYFPKPGNYRRSNTAPNPRQQISETTLIKKSEPYDDDSLPDSPPAGGGAEEAAEKRTPSISKTILRKRKRAASTHQDATFTYCLTRSSAVPALKQRAGPREGQVIPEIDYNNPCQCIPIAQLIGHGIILGYVRFKMWIGGCTGGRCCGGSVGGDGVNVPAAVRGGRRS